MFNIPHFTATIDLTRADIDVPTYSTFDVALRQANHRDMVAKFTREYLSNMSNEQLLGFVVEHFPSSAISDNVLSLLDFRVDYATAKFSTEYGGDTEFERIGHIVCNGIPSLTKKPLWFNRWELKFNIITNRSVIQNTPLLFNPITGKRLPSASNITAKEFRSSSNPAWFHNGWTGQERTPKQIAHDVGMRYFRCDTIPLFDPVSGKNISVSSNHDFESMQYHTEYRYMPFNPVTSRLRTPEEIGNDVSGKNELLVSYEKPRWRIHFE